MTTTRNPSQVQHQDTATDSVERTDIDDRTGAALAAYRLITVHRRDCPAETRKHEDYQDDCSENCAAVCKRMAAIGLTDDGNPLPTRLRPRCGARTRTGTDCVHPVVPGKRRCRFHGGMSTGPKTEAGRQRIAEAQRKRWANREP